MLEMQRATTCQPLGGDQVSTMTSPLQTYKFTAGGTGAEACFLREKKTLGEGNTRNFPERSVSVLCHRLQKEVDEYFWHLVVKISLFWMVSANGHLMCFGPFDQPPSSTCHEARVDSPFFSTIVLFKNRIRPQKKPGNTAFPGVSLVPRFGTAQNFNLPGSPWLNFELEPPGSPRWSGPGRSRRRSAAARPPVGTIASRKATAAANAMTRMHK